MLFCWVLWYCVPRLKTDFVPCVQRSAVQCQPVPNTFGGSFGGKSVRQILTRTAQINAQLWSRWEIWILTSQGFRAGKAPRTNNEILLSSKKLYASTTPQHPRTPPPVTARNALVGASSHRIGAVLVQPNTALSSPLSGDFFTKTGFSCAGFACTGKSRTNKY